jgi:drug/metabolite transporter (DMT)-like permease
MKPSAIVGILLIIAGAFVLIRGLSYTSQRSVLKVGDLKASVEEKHAIPAWVGGLAIVGGLALVLAGTRRRS